MSKYLFSYGVLALAMLILAPHTARATMFSGNPTTDGWTVGGYSNNIGLTNLPAGFTNPPGPFVQGTYVSGAGKALYVLYFNQTTATAEFLTECGMALCGAWQVGDKIVGMGAVFPAVPGGGTQNNTASVFLKWGVSSSAYSVSSLDPTIGNGNSNYDVGEGGLGSVFASLNLSAGGVVTAPSTAFQWTGITSQSIGPLNSIVFNSLISGGVFTSFQGYLNVTLINSINPY